MPEETQNGMIAVSSSTMNALVDYLMSRPYSEVVHIIAALQNEAVAVALDSPRESLEDSGD